MEPLHIGRSFVGHPLEDACPCPQEPCGLIDAEKTLSGCPEHGPWKAKTLRQFHAVNDCPAATAARP